MSNLLPRPRACASTTASHAPFAPEDRFALEDPFALEDYVQLACTLRRSVLVRLSQDGRPSGTVSVKDGRLWSASDERGHGSSAFKRLLGSARQVRVEALCEADTGPRTINLSWQHLLLQAAVERDERSAGEVVRPRDRSSALSPAPQISSALSPAPQISSALSPAPQISSALRRPLAVVSVLARQLRSQLSRTGSKVVQAFGPTRPMPWTKRESAIDARQLVPYAVLVAISVLVWLISNEWPSSEDPRQPHTAGLDRPTPAFATGRNSR